MTKLIVAGELLKASADDRILSYRLLPFGSPGRTNLGKLTASASSVTVPADVTGLVVNMEHDDTRPVGKFAQVTRDDSGLLADVRVLATKAGDDYLTEAREGVRTGISVELDGPVIRNGTLMAGVLSGAGVCAQPAFADAKLIAADAGELPEDTHSESTTTETITVDGVEYVRKTTSTYTTETEVVGGEPEAENAEESAESEAGPVSTNLTASAAPIAPHNGGAKPSNGLSEVTRLLASANAEGGERKLLAALSDIVPANVTNTEQPAFLGELWHGKAYQRRIVPLFASAPLTSLRLQGWRWVTKPAVAPYAGNKTAVPSNTVSTEQVNLVAERIAGAHDIDRKFRDFNDTEFWAAYYRAMTESYAQVSDAQVLADVLAAATEVAPGDVPSGVSPAMAAIVDGALAVLQGTRTLPTFAVVAVDLYRDILLTREDDTLTYLNSALGLEDGTVQSFRIVPALGGEVESGQVLVGARDAVTVHELGGEAPIRVEAENIAQGGIDAGVFGYYAVNVHDADGLALVDTAAV